MGINLKNYNMTRMFKGFRPGKTPKYRINLKALEKCEVLTSLQHEILQDFLSKCAYTKEIKVEGKEPVNKTVFSASPEYIARAVALVDKPYNDAKVDHLGNPWKRNKMNVPQPVLEKKGKSRKDLKEKK
jgi:hypothetical protein